MDLRPFQCAQFLGPQFLKLGNFLLKMIPVLEGLKPVTKANIAAVKIVVEQDAQLSVKDIASCTGISEGSVQTILKMHLDLNKYCARWVPHLLTEEQKTQCLKCAKELLETYKGCISRVSSNLLIGDETWVHMFEPQRRADNKQCKRKDQKRPCIAKRAISLKKMLYAIFFNSSGPVAQVPCPSGHTVTGRFYKNSVQKKVKEFCNKNDQAMDGQESTFYMTTPSLIHVRLLSLFWLLKR